MPPFQPPPTSAARRKVAGNSKMGDLGKYLGNIEIFQVVPFLENFNLGNLEACLCPQKALVPTRPRKIALFWTHLVKQDVLKRRWQKHVQQT